LPLGLNASILLGVAYLGGLLRTKLFKENVTAQVFIVLILTFFHQFLMFYWMNTILTASYHAGYWLKQAMVMSVYHCLLGPLLFKWLARWIPGEDVYKHLIAGHSAETSRLRLRRL
jgi:rod shape-determining protein MreD